MTAEQFTRWRDLALRMASIHTRGKRWEAEPIGGFALAWRLEEYGPDAAWVAESVADFIDGIDAEDVACILDWDSSHRPKGRPVFLCDQFSEWSTDEVYYHFRAFATERERYAYCAAVDEEAEDAIRQQITDDWSDPVRSCVRAAMDVAVSPSMGVLGFTAGDVRRMYPEGVPEWFKDFFTNGETVRPDKVCPGVGFTLCVVGPSPSFDDMADDDELWL